MKINTKMERYMDCIMSLKNVNDTSITSFFSNNRLNFINKNIRNDNYYTLDKYNLVIRKNEYNDTKSATGWIYLNDVISYADKEPINIHIDPILLQVNSSDLVNITIQTLQREYPSLFKSPRGLLYRIYSNLNMNEFINKI